MPLGEELYGRSVIMWNRDIYSALSPTGYRRPEILHQNASIKFGAWNTGSLSAVVSGVYESNILNGFSRVLTFGGCL
jgi:hypothetical protein